MWFPENYFLNIIREILDSDFYPQEINYDNLCKNRSNRFLNSGFLNFVFCIYKIETISSNSPITYNLGQNIWNKI